MTEMGESLDYVLNLLFTDGAKKYNDKKTTSLQTISGHYSMHVSKHHPSFAHHKLWLLAGNQSLFKCDQLVALGLQADYKWKSENTGHQILSLRLC